MGKPTPLTGQVVTAISDARRVIYRAFARDGIDSMESEALLLLDTAIYTGERADLARRASDQLRDSGIVTPWIERQGRELDRDFAHVIEIRDAA